MDTPVVQFSRRLGQGVEGGGRPQENALQPHGEWLNWLRCGARLGINFDNVRGVARAVVFGETGHSALLQLLDPLDFSLEAVADIDGETQVFGVEDVPLRASLEGVGVGFDKVFESIDSGIELSYFGHVVILPLFDCFEQGFSDSLQGIGVEVGAAVEDVSGRAG